MRRLRPRHDYEERRNADRGENMERARNRIARSRFAAPCIRCELLEPMKKKSHPEPAREDGDDTRDEAGKKRVQSIHEGSASVAFSTRWLQRPFCQTKKRRLLSAFLIRNAFEPVYPTSE